MEGRLRGEVSEGGVPKYVREKNWSKFEKFRQYLWEKFRWGNLNSVFVLTVLVVVGTYITGLGKKRYNDGIIARLKPKPAEPPADEELLTKHLKMNEVARLLDPVEAERRLENVVESLAITQKHFLYHWFNTVVTAALVLTILACYNYNNFMASNLILYTVTTWWLLAIIPGVYLSSAGIMLFNNVVKPGRSLLEPEFRRTDITEQGKIPDDEKTMIHMAFPMRKEKDLATGVLKDMPNFNSVMGDGTAEGIGAVEKMMEEARDPNGNRDYNLYFDLLIQVFGGSGTEGEEHYKATLKLVQERLDAMPEHVRKRVYVHLRRQKMTKPPTHYSVQRWLREDDDEYCKIDPRYNVDPDISKAKNKDQPTLNNEWMNPIVETLGGDPADPDDLRNIRQESINDKSIPPLMRKSRIKNTLVYDPGNLISYAERADHKGEGILYLVSVMADRRNTESFFRGKMIYSDVHATIHSNIMKDFPQTMLGHVAQAQYIIEDSLRAPGKYAYRNEDFYRDMITTNAYQDR